LFHVVAAIIRRLTRNRQGVPLATRLDKYERITSEPQPFLFQRTEVINPETLRSEFAKLALAVEHPELAGCRFTPHDFRHVRHRPRQPCLLIHIGAALLGHLDVQTTHGYVTVVQEDVIRHYQTQLAGRWAARPVREYRTPTAKEWYEFEEHFDKRKVELGNCGRPYTTPGEHEYACIRCPMLQVDPVMIQRLDEINTDLVARRELAETKGWLGELEDIDLTLRFLQDKRADAQRLATLGPTNLGMPVIRT
jgi:transposase